MKRCTVVLLHYIVSSYDSSIDDRKACSMCYFIFEERDREEQERKKRYIYIHINEIVNDC
jgi:hypothetical protein